MPGHLCSQAQDMVASLIDYFQRECDNGGPLMPLSAIRDRVADALKVSISTVNRIVTTRHKSEAQKGPTPRQRIKNVVDIDEFDQIAIRNVIYEMYRNKEHLTLRILGHKLKERDIFNGCLASLWKVVQNIGFKYRKDDPNRGLMELPYIAIKRINFLQEYFQLKKEGLRQFVFLDETSTFQVPSDDHGKIQASIVLEKLKLAVQGKST